MSPKGKEKLDDFFMHCCWRKKIRTAGFLLCVSAFSILWLVRAGRHLFAHSVVPFQTPKPESRTCLIGRILKFGPRTGIKCQALFYSRPKLPDEHVPFAKGSFKRTTLQMARWLEIVEKLKNHGSWAPILNSSR